MKKKPLAYYLNLMKSAQNNQEWIKEKKHGETALKKLNKLSYTPFEEYLLHARLGYTYLVLSNYSRSMDAFYRANLIASKHHLAPEYTAFSAYMLGRNFLHTGSINQSISQFQKVLQYYQTHSENKSPMDKEKHFLTIVALGYCYLANGEIEKVREIIEEKLPSYQTHLNNVSEYFFLKGKYLMAKEEYSQARQAFLEHVKMSEQFNFPPSIGEGKIKLAIIDLLEKKMEPAIRGLQSVIKYAGNLKINDIVCEAGLLLSKCYILNNTPRKAIILERQIKPILNKLDIVWLYEKTKEFEQLYSRLKALYKTAQADMQSIPQVLIHAFKEKNEPSSSKEITIIGESAQMRDINQLIKKIAATDLPVLIQGETGTGKELVARTIHLNSLRQQKIYLALNCGAMAESLLESELFGYKKGAFTDAYQDKKGYIELASEGTLFLDEIAEMSPKMQQKLLRLLEEKLIWRLGAEKSVSINTRFIFAGNQSIEELIKAKKLREDLYYRINTIVITLPPLRDRKDDIPLLINHFFSKYSRPSSIVSNLSSEALKLLVDYTWPGNIRELENEIKRLCALYPNAETITQSMLSQTITHQPATNIIKPIDGLKGRALRNEYEKPVIIEALKKYNGNISKTAAHLGFSRYGLSKKIKRLKIDNI